MRAFYQSDTDEDTCKCICGNKMKLYVPKHAPPMPMVGGGLPPINQLQGFCRICSVQLLPTTYAYQCTVKSDKHPNAPYPYQICSRCGRHSRKHKKKRHNHKYYSSNYNPYQSYHAPPIYSNHILSPNPNANMQMQMNDIEEYKKVSQFNRFLNTKNKRKHYEQVHQLINQASDKAITNIFNQIKDLSNKQKRHLLHTIYDNFDSNNAIKYESIGIDDIDNINGMNENEIDSMAIGPSRLNNNDDNKVSIMEDVQKHIIKDNGYQNLIAGNVNISYENDDDFILKNAHLLEQQQNALHRIRMERMEQMQQMQNEMLHIDDIMGINPNDLNDLDNDSIRANIDVNDEQILGLSSPSGDDGIDSKNNIDNINNNQQNDILHANNNNINNNSVVSDKLMSAAESVKRYIENKEQLDGISNEINVIESEALEKDTLNDISNEIQIDNMDMKQNNNEVIESEILEENNQNINENNKVNYNIAITQSDEMQITQINSNIVDTDDDIDLSGIEFDTKDDIPNGNNNNNINVLQVDNNNAGDSSANEEADEKLDELHNDIIINNNNNNNNGNTSYIPNMSIKYEYKQYINNDIEDISDATDSESSDNEIFQKTGDLRVAELEELFGCTIGDNLTEDLGQDLWWYRVFVFLSRSELCNIFETSRYFYYMQIYHQLIYNRIINISSLPALVWKLAIFKDFKIEEKLKKSMKYIRIRFMKSMDWNKKLSLSYLQELNLIALPDTKQIYIEYLSLSDNTLDDTFLKMINMMFTQLWKNIKNINYIEVINKTDGTNPKNDFTWKLQSFNHLISSLNNFNRIRVPCWNQNLFNPQIYLPQFDRFKFNNTYRNIEYIYLNEMRFENFASLLPNDNAGIQAVNYFQQLQKLKGIILIFGEDTSKKHQEMISVSESMVSLLEMLKDTIQYMIIGVNRLEQIIFNPFDINSIPYKSKYYDDKYDDYIDDINALPQSCILYQYNYAFKLELKKLFWTNYIQPTQESKNEKIINMKKQKELDAQNTIKNLIQFEIEQHAPAHAIQHVIGDINIGNDNDSDDSSESTSSLVRFNDDYNHNVEIKMSDSEGEEEDEKKDNKVYTLEDLGNTFEYYGQQNKFKAVRGRAAFIVIYNTQIYIEDDDVNDDRVPLNTNSAGLWECPYCSMWNARHSRRCGTCRKKKTKYIPQEVLMQQQQIEQQKQYRKNVMEYENYDVDVKWTCTMCYSKNDNNAKNCQACTLERPQ